MALSKERRKSSHTSKSCNAKTKSQVRMTGMNELLQESRGGGSTKNNREDNVLFSPVLKGNFDRNHRDGRLIVKDSMKKQRKEQSRIHQCEGNDQTRTEHRPGLFIPEGR